jgi:hypothetical protein
MDGAITIVIVTDRAIKKVVAEDAIERFHLGGRCLRRLCGNSHSIGDFGRAGPHQSAFDFNHAGVTGLNRTELRVVADVGNRPANAVDQIYEKFVDLGFMLDTVNRNLDHDSSPLTSSEFRCARVDAVQPKGFAPTVDASPSDTCPGI